MSSQGGNNYEDSFIDNIDFSFKKQKENILLDKTRLSRMLEKMQSLEIFDRPELSDFSDIYPKEKIEADERKVMELESIFSENEQEQKELKIISELFEGIIISESEKSEWLGENAIVHSASRFDDIKNGVDAICEFTQEEENKFLALGIDVTFGSFSKTEVDKKLKKIEAEIRNNKISSVEYFSDSSGKHQKLELPKVIAGADTKTVKELLELWDKGDKKALSTHPYQCALLISIRQQAAYFFYVAEECGNEIASNKYYEAVNILNDIIEPRKEILTSLYDEAFKDEVIAKIMEKTNFEINKG